MSTLTYEIRPDGLVLHMDQGLLALTPYTAHTIRVRYTLRAEFNDQASLMVVAAPDQNTPFTVDETADSLLFSTAAVRIAIDKQTAAFTYYDGQGALLAREPAGGGKTLAPIDVLVSDFGASTVAEAGLSADGVRIEARNVHKRIDRQAYHTKLAFEWARGEALYGLGSHEEGMLNLRGQHQYLYQQNMKAVVPVLVSTRGYGILLDSYALMTFHDDAFGSYLWSDVDDEMDYYFVHGPEFDQIVHELRSLTGKAPMLPKWAFGYIQSKERYKTQAELIEIVQEYRRRGLPLDCIVLDWMSWTGDLWGEKTLDPARFPDPQQMMHDLHALHARLMVSIWPIMRPGGGNWQEMKDRGFLLGNQATYNAFDEAARALYWQQANAGLFAHGIDAWWCDCTEPFEADWNGAVKPEPEERLRINTEEARRYLDPEFINAYSLVHSQGIYAGQRAVTEEKRVLNLTRSAYMGQQRYGAITWSGDIAATWETLHKQIAEGLNFCVTGSPYWTVDVGAFFVKNRPDLWFWNGDYEGGVDDLGYRELFVRWFQYATFLPMLRAHGADTPRELWRFGDAGDPMYDTLVKFLRLRYRLMPYIYSLSGWITHHDYTMLRLLAFDFRSDPNTYDIRDQFMFGPALLVSPVTQPMHYTAGSTPVAHADKTRSVYLPAGSEWWNFWSDERLAGGQTITAAADLETLPLFVRAGSIVPMVAPMQYVDEQADAVVELHIYPGRDGRFQLYEDAGDGYDYEHGAFSTIDMAWQEASGQLTIGQRSGSFPGMATRRQFRLVLHGQRQRPHRQEGDAHPLINYEGDQLVVEG
ncbi:MAG TPA: glycoside hydrolase family 31 protein [Caldilinea sp.]|nr:glycoside hydrolase family 31 protein [Caldilinea sp.]